MDQQTLTNKYPTIHTPDDYNMDHSSSMNSSASDSTGNKSFLRRVSNSDTRLHIPHFLSSQDQGFHTNLSSLFENVAGFNHNNNQLGSSHENMSNLNTSGGERKLSVTKPGLDRNKSAFELCSNKAATDEPAGGLRKVSSVANYNNLSDNHDTISSHGSNSLLSSAFHFVTGHSNSNSSSLAVQKIPEDEEGGLKMMVSSSSSFSPSALTASSGLHDNPIVHSNSAHLPSSNLADISTLSEKNKPKAGMLGMFSRGFFAKPVHDAREDSYRYLLAADKF